MAARKRRSSSHYNPIRRSRRELEWQDEGLCAQVDPEIFYSDILQDCYDAIEVCARCPVVEKCLRESLRNTGDIQNGVWGGTLPADRKRIMSEAAKRNKPIEWAFRILMGISEQRRMP